MVNNAGFGDAGNFIETNLNKELDMINVNIKAYHVLMKKFLKDFTKRGYGRILNVASMSGFMPGPYMATYYATKSYIIKLSLAIYQELKEMNSNVKISIFCPGPVKTNFTAVANVRFHIREANSYKVAKYAIDHLNSFYIVPGIDIKFAKLGAKLFPSSLVAKVTYMIQKKKLQ